MYTAVSIIYHEYYILWSLLENRKLFSCEIEYGRMVEKRIGQKGKGTYDFDGNAFCSRALLYTTLCYYCY